MNIPEAKPAADWASEWLGYNVGSEQKRLVEWIDEIKANAAAHARYKALTEAAGIAGKGGCTDSGCGPIGGQKWHSDRCPCGAEANILALRDAKET